MDSRSRVDDDADRLGELPDCILHDILSRLGSRQAVQTSVLSSRWRHLWRDVPCVDIDQGEFANDPWEQFEDFADHMQQPSPPPLAPKLDAFRLNMSSRSNTCKHAVSDRWIRRALRRSPVSVAIRASTSAVARWIMPPQPSTLRRLTTLRLVRVSIAEDIVGRRLGDLTSPTLIRLAVVKPRGHVVPAQLIHSAPCLASLRLELTVTALFNVIQDSSDSPPPLACITEASIQIVRQGFHNLPVNNTLRNGRLEFLSSVRRLLARLKNAATLRLSGFSATALLDDQSQEFQPMQSLRALVLEDCDLGKNFNVLTSILGNTPNLEKLGQHLCKFVGVTPVSDGHGVAGALRCDKLESVEITSRRDDRPRLLDLLSKLSNGVPPEQWQRIRKLNKLVI